MGVEATSLECDKEGHFIIRNPEDELSLWEWQEWGVFLVEVNHINESRSDIRNDERK